MAGHAGRATATLGPCIVARQRTFRPSRAVGPAADVVRRAAAVLPAPLLVVVLAAGCAPDAPRPGPASQAAASAASPASDPAPQSDEHDWFADRAAAAGLDFVHFNGMSGEFYFPEIVPAGVGLFDYDNDGDLDAYFVQGQMMGEGKTLGDALFEPVGPLPLRGRLFRNDLGVEADGTRTLRFTDVTDASGIDARGHGMGVAAGDFDNDGWVDLYLTYLGTNQLYRNNGDGTFSDVSAASGTDDPGWGVSASFVDVDGDGWLDLYVGNYVWYDFNAELVCTVLSDRRSHCGPERYEPQSDRLYRNRGDGTFANVTGTAFVVTEPFGPALGVSTADFDDDGWMDIYVANDGRPNLLWMNRGDGTFGDLGLLSGSAVSEQGRPEASMGVDAGDFDNDGDEDLIMTHMPTEGHNLYVNDGSGLFRDGSAETQVHGLSLGYTGWGTAWIDYDNDGWLDILFANGALDAKPGRPDHPMPFEERNLLLRNTRDGRFEDVTDQAGAALALVEVTRGAAFGDVDNDGDTDVLLGNLNGRVRLLVNTVGNRSHWLGLRIVGERRAATASEAAAQGRDMLGARVEVVRDGQPTLRRRVRTDGSYASANDPRVLVGLGESTAAPTVRVRWPGGGSEEWNDLAIDGWATLVQGEGTAR
ncbi:MAG: CRTAC1 family protein [Acidobacteria bacterium]|nr:CRTAC1 family protein [Acidobacteriota bacterium]